MNSSPWESCPPVKQSAIAELLGEIFNTQLRNTNISEPVKEEVVPYNPMSCISVDYDPCLWWEANELIYSHISAKIDKCYLAIRTTSVTTKREFSTNEDIVTASSALTATKMDKLIWQNNMKVE